MDPGHVVAAHLIPEPAGAEPGHQHQPRLTGKRGDQQLRPADMVHRLPHQIAGADRAVAGDRAARSRGQKHPLGHDDALGRSGRARGEQDCPMRIGIVRRFQGRWIGGNAAPAACLEFHDPACLPRVGGAQIGHGPGAGQDQLRRRHRQRMDQRRSAGLGRQRDPDGAGQGQRQDQRDMVRTGVEHRDHAVAGGDALRAQIGRLLQGGRGEGADADRRAPMDQQRAVGCRKGAIAQQGAKGACERGLQRGGGCGHLFSPCRVCPETFASRHASRRIRRTAGDTALPRRSLHPVRARGLRKAVA